MKTQQKHLGLFAVVLIAGVASTFSSISAWADHKPGHKGSMPTGDMKARNAEMLIKTLSEEKTEIKALAAQQAQFKKMGGAENMRIASMFGRWIREHKAAGPTLERLIRQNGGDPAAAKIIKAPVLGDKMKMLHATHMDHMAAVMSSQQRHGLTNSAAIKTAMRKRATLARKHLRQMEPYHNARNCPMCAKMGHKM